MQTIITKFHGQTNTRGSRITASCEAGRVTVSWDYGFSVDGNHCIACETLRQKLGWTQLQGYPKMIGGETKSGFVWVFVTEPATTN